MANKSDSFTITNSTFSAHAWNFQWNLHNLHSRTGSIYSSEISFKERCPLKWKIFVEIEKDDRSYYGLIPFRMSVGLQRLDSMNFNVKATLFFEIKNQMEELYLKESTESLFSKLENSSKSCWFDMPRADRDVQGYNNKTFYLKGKNYLKINGKVFIEECCVQRTPVISISDITKQLQLDFKQLWKNSEFTDVEIKVKKDVVRAHRFVLCARSPVFKRMFQNDMKEKTCNSITIPDIEKSVLEIFLAFLYTGIVEDKQFNTVMALYSAADKYEVKTLQETCRDTLVSFITHDTVSVIMKLADMHNDDSLKNIAVEYICHHFPSVEATVQWNNLLDTDPRLASFALKQVSLNVSKK